MADGDDLLEAMNAENAERNEEVVEEVVEEETVEEEAVEEEAAEEEDETSSEKTGDEEDGEGEVQEEAEEEIDLDGDEVPTNAVPVKTWVKQKNKFKAREQALRTELETLKSQPAAGASVDSKQYEQYKDVLGKFQAGAKQHPAAAMILAAFEKGQEPDWAVVNDTLTDYVQALPAQDPRTQAIIRQNSEALEKLQYESDVRSFENFRVEENKTILQEFEVTEDSPLMKSVNQVTIDLVKAQPKGSFVKPDRVAIARAIHSYGKHAKAGLLKVQKKAGPAKKGAAIPKPQGSGAAKVVDDSWALEPQDSEKYLKGLAADIKRNS